MWISVRLGYEADASFMKRSDSLMAGVVDFDYMWTRMKRASDVSAYGWADHGVHESQFSGRGYPMPWQEVVQIPCRLYIYS